MQESQQEKEFKNGDKVRNKYRPEVKAYFIGLDPSDTTFGLVVLRHTPVYLTWHISAIELDPS